MNGVILVNKEEGLTSRDVVNQVGKILKTKKIGHTGTLDPMASGVLVLCVGTATKLVEVLTATEKEYIAEITLGIETDTLDITGNILKEEQIEVTKEQIEYALQSMIGTYNQEVPIYSAIHVNGKKLYEYARKNETVELPSRLVTIFELELLEILSENRFVIKTRVSKGTYIRSLIRDIAKKLNTIGVMSRLKRTKQGEYSLEQCATLKQIEDGNYKIYSISEVLKGYHKVVADSNLEKKIRNGQLIAKNEYPSVVFFESQEETPLALYQVYEKDKSYLKPWKMF